MLKYKCSLLCFLVKKVGRLLSEKHNEEGADERGDELDELIASGSFGSERARAIAQQTPPDVLEEALDRTTRRLREKGLLGPSRED